MFVYPMKQTRAIIENRPAVDRDSMDGRANLEPAISATVSEYSGARERQDALEARWRFGAPPLTVPGFAGYNNPRLPQGGADRFIQSGARLGGVADSSGTVPSSAVVEERRRLAREIHDTLVQEFAGILLHLEAAKSSDDAETCTIFECLARARDLARCGLEDARRMLLGLRPKSLEGTTLSAALRQLAERFSRDSRIACKFCSDGGTRDIPVEIQDELYRVAQEALCNVCKHSRATSASLSLGYEPGVVVLKIKDNGQGFGTMRHQCAGHGYGLGTMQDRAHRLGGQIEINTAPGRGTEVSITVPLPGNSQMERNRQ